MGKEKKRNEDTKDLEQTTFYYELLGIVFIIFSITILGRLGTLGNFFTVIFKVIFGDWYWIFVMFLLFYGFMNLFRHKRFNFKNQRFIGYIFISFGLLMFAHFPLHNYISELDNNYFGETWGIYRSYIATKIDTYLGGGLIGAVMFYAVFYLFGSFGVILIGFLIMMFGLSLIINKPILEIFKTLGGVMKNSKVYLDRFNSFFKYRIGEANAQKAKRDTSIFNRSKQVPLKILEEYQNVMNYNFQEKLCLETRSLIHSVFSNLHIEYRDVDFTISYKITSYKFTIFSEYDLSSLLSRLTNVMEEDILIAQEGRSLILQVTNKYPQILTIRELLMIQVSLNHNYILPLGLTYENKLCEFDLSKSGNLLVIGTENSGIKNFINYYIFALFVKEKLFNYEIEIYDVEREFDYLSSLIKVTNDVDINTYLNSIIKEIDDKLELISNYKVTSIDEYNKKIEIEGSDNPPLKRKFIIINQLNIDRETYSYFENKLMYVTQLGEKAGVISVYIIRKEEALSSIIMSLFIHKLCFKVDLMSFSQRVMNNENATYLQNLGDAFYLNHLKARRIQTALVSKKDQISVKDYLLK